MVCMKRAVLLLLAVPALAFAQAFPTKPVRIIVPSAPGGGIDASARITAGKLQEMWGLSRTRGCVYIQ